jgi:hypothetical protein
MAETFPVTERDYAVDWEANPPRQLPVEAPSTTSQTLNLFCYLPTRFDWHAYQFNNQLLFFLRHSLADAMWEMFLILVRYVCCAAHRWNPDSRDHPPPLVVSFEKSSELHLLPPPFGPPSMLAVNPLRANGTKEMLEKWVLSFQQNALMLQAWIAKAKERSRELGARCTWRWPEDAFSPSPYALRSSWTLQDQEDPDKWSYRDIWGLTIPTPTLRRPPLINAIAERAALLLEEDRQQRAAPEVPNNTPAPPYSPSHFSPPHEFFPGPAPADPSMNTEEDNSLSSSITEHATGGTMSDYVDEEDPRSQGHSEARIIEDIVRVIIIDDSDSEEEEVD